MATKEQHVGEAAHDETLARSLAAMNEFGWAVTLLFYASVHLIQAYLVQLGRITSTHSARENAMERIRPLQPVQRHYDTLKIASEAARYDCLVMTQADFERAQIRYRRLQGHMQRLLR